MFHFKSRAGSLQIMIFSKKGKKTYFSLHLPKYSLVLLVDPKMEGGGLISIFCLSGLRGGVDFFFDI